MNDIIIHKESPSDRVTVEDLDGDGLILLGSSNRRLAINRGILDFESGIEVESDFLENILAPGGTLTGSDETLSLTGSYLNQGGEFVHNSGLVRFIGGTNRSFRCNSVPTDEFYNVHIAKDGSADLDMVSGDTLKVLNRLDLIRGQVDVGMLAIRDTLFLHPGWEYGSADIAFIDGGDSHFMVDACVWSLPDISVDKSVPESTVWVEDVDQDGMVIIGGDNRFLDIREGMLAFEPGLTVFLDFSQININAGGSLQGSSGILHVKGSYLNYGGQFIHDMATVRFYGASDTQFRSDVTPTDLFYDVLVEKSASRDLDIVGNGNLHVGNQLSPIDGQVRVGTIQVDGNVIIGSLFDQGNAPLLLSGSTDQELFVNTTQSNYSSDITVDKAGGGEVILRTPLRMFRSGQQLVLSKGVITTTATNKLIMLDNVLCQDASEDSFINGPMEKIGNDAFTFPVGKGLIYAPIGISNPSNAGHSFTAEYFPVDPGPLYDRSSKAPSIYNVSSAEYWILDRGATTTSNVFVTLSWDLSRSGRINDLGDLVVARWDGMQWQDHGNFNASGAPVSTSGTIRTAARVTDFSPFTLGSISSNNPLPVEWLFFQANLHNGFVNLEWATASEIHSEDFEVQRSQDGLIWETIGTVQAAGYSSSQLNYQSVDDSPLQGISYYRLKQNDFDGQFEYSEVKVISSLEHREVRIRAFPNPTDGKVMVQSDQPGTEEIRVLDHIGRDLSGLVEVMRMSDTQVQLDMVRLPAGVYLLSVGTSSLRILRQ